jgi:hypothetical protein
MDVSGQLHVSAALPTGKLMIWYNCRCGTYVCKLYNNCATLSVYLSVKRHNGKRCNIPQKKDAPKRRVY